MFAGCSTTCPIQGAVFSAAADLVKDPQVQFLSLTIDPLGDSPKALGAWLARFGEHRAWSAGVPKVQDVDALSAFLRGVQPKPGTHSAQVFLFDRQARLAYRTGDMPAPEQLAQLLAMLAAA
jgi:protein SCO1/2